jgi:formylmethanofuran dehydrogenase subunit E-like metal-binding protein
MVSEDTANMEDSDGDLVAMAAQNVKLTTAMAGRCPEIVETAVAEIVDVETFQLDCTTLWAEVFSSEAAITGDYVTAKIPEFARHIRAQFQDLFQDPMGLAPTHKDGSSRIRTIPGVESPHKSPYQLTPHK